MMSSAPVKKGFSRKNLWENAPKVVKTTVGRILGCVPQAYLLGSSFREQLAFASEAQWWDAERARDYQMEHVRRTLTLAYKHTAYYRRTFDEVGFEPGDLRSLDDLRRLPTIDKNALRAHLDDMLAADLSSGGIDYVATGGSSGEPLRFYIGSDRSATEYAYLVAGWQRIGYDLKLPQAIFRGQMVEPDTNGLRHTYDPVLRRHYYSNFHMNDESMGRYLDHLATIGPCYLHVYPSSIAALAGFLKRTGRPGPSNVRGILAGSENVYEDDRKLAEDVFKVRYLSWYGHSEKLVLAAECEHSTDYHVWPTYGHCELIDENGDAVTTPGKRGEILGTGFINKVIPFVRYRTGDYATYTADRCDACGRQQMILSHIEGRWPQGNLVAADGAVITLTTLNVHDDTFEGVVDYQFCQDTPGQACLRVVPARELSEDEQARIVERMSKRLQGQLSLTLEVRSKLEKTARGKLPRVVRSESGPQTREDTVETSRSEL